MDPYSNQDIRTVIDLAEQIETSVERDNLKFQVSQLTTLKFSLSLSCFVKDVFEVCICRLPARRRFRGVDSRALSFAQSAPVRSGMYPCSQAVSGQMPEASLQHAAMEEVYRRKVWDRNADYEAPEQLYATGCGKWMGCRGRRQY